MPKKFNVKKNLMLSKRLLPERVRMKTSFVILNYNCWQKTEKLALKVASFEEVDAVVIVDNVSTDNSYEHLKKISHKKIYIFQSKKNGGYSYGNNYGARVCRKLGMEIMFISNPDVSVEEDVVKKIKEQFADKNYSILSGVEYDIHGNLVYPPLCKRREYWDDFLDCFFIGRKLSKKKFDVALDQEAVVQKAEMIKGSFFAVCLKDFMEAGGFDENVFLYCEERIISRRMDKIGKKIGIVTDAKYVHTHSAVINNSYQKVSQRIKILYYSRIYYNKKYNQIGIVKYILLLAAMKISVFEYAIRDKIHFRSHKTVY